MTHAPALDDKWLSELFSSYSVASSIIVAVSGGPDSIALMHMLAQWTPPDRPSLLVASVDHGLRPEAADEAQWVAQEAAKLGLQHRILTWIGVKPQAGIQESAREARYGLLIALAKEAGASHLLTAHTLDDQAETLLMRMASGSGLEGLGGMRAMRMRDGICHARPLLHVPKATLLALCKRYDWPFISDPSNENDRYTRVRWRKLMPVLTQEGLTAERLYGLAERARRADEALDAKAEEALARATRGKPGAFDAAPLADEPFEIALRVLALALSRSCPSPEHRRLHRLEACLARLREALAQKTRLRLTLGGAMLSLDRLGTLKIEPEPPRKRGR